MEPNGIGHHPRLNDEIKFQPSFAAIIDQIDAGIDLSIAYPAIGLNARAPALGIRSHKIIYLPWKGIEALHFRLKICANQVHAQHCRRQLLFAALPAARPLLLPSRGPLKTEHGLSRSQKHGIAWSARDKFNFSVRLAVIGLKAHRSFSLNSHPRRPRRT